MTSELSTKKLRELLDQERPRLEALLKTLVGGPSPIDTNDITFFVLHLRSAAGMMAATELAGPRRVAEKLLTGTSGGRHPVVTFPLSGLHDAAVMAELVAPKIAPGLDDGAGDSIAVVVVDQDGDPGIFWLPLAALLEGVT